MNVDTSAQARLTAEMKQRHAGSVVGGGGGPHDPAMEARITKLEDQFSKIEKLLETIAERVRGVELDLREMKGRQASLPTTWAMIATVIGGQVTLAGLLFAALKLSAEH